MDLIFSIIAIDTNTHHTISSKPSMKILFF